VVITATVTYAGEPSEHIVLEVIDDDSPGGTDAARMSFQQGGGIEEGGTPNCWVPFSGPVPTSTTIEITTSTPTTDCAQPGSSTCGAVILGGTAFVSPSGVAGVFLGCFHAQPCRGSMTISDQGDVIAHRDAYTIGAEDGGIVHLKLSRSAWRSLAVGHLASSVQIVDPSGLVRSARVTLVAFGDATRTARAADEGTSRIAIFGHTGFVSPSRIVEVFLGCFGSQDCTGTITVTVGHTIIAQYSGRLVSAEDGALARIPLNAHGRELLAGHIKAIVTVSDTGGSTATAPLTLEYFR
jgi:hypothetical protein